MSDTDETKRDAKKWAYAATWQMIERSMCQGEGTLSRRRMDALREVQDHLIRMQTRFLEEWER